MKLIFQSSSQDESSDPSTEHAIILRHSQLLTPMGLLKSISVKDLESTTTKPTTIPKLPYLYWLPKLHKNPIGARFIAGSSNCTTTKLSKVLTRALLKVSHTLRAKDDDLLIHTGIRRYFILDGYEQFTRFFRKWKRNFSLHDYRKIASGDFSTLYTTLPPDDLIDKISQVIDEAWNWIEKQTGEKSILFVETPTQSDSVKREENREREKNKTKGTMSKRKEITISPCSLESKHRQLIYIRKEETGSMTWRIAWGQRGLPGGLFHRQSNANKEML
jgi:hypothetical protein